MPEPFGVPHDGDPLALLRQHGCTWQRGRNGRPYDREQGDITLLIRRNHTMQCELCTVGKLCNAADADCSHVPIRDEHPLIHEESAPKADIMPFPVFQLQ